ncbi:MAG TPA: DUF4162 domain-containing protein, partial [Candidatus Hydrogenedentes bacterium]|nr:DUF4162 domain-containing protein [Candidatus Hydrogenedentota bacterium]
MCNKIGIIEHGTLLAAGEFRAILNSLKQEMEVRVEVIDGEAEAQRILEGTAGVGNLECSGGEFRFTTQMDRIALAALNASLVGAGVKVLSFSQDEGTLEDIFLQVTKGGL